MAHSPLRVRFAPSPTGALHIGNIRTALFSWLAARTSGGQFILRIEDTDQERFVEGVNQIIFDTLDWLGMTWDEGPGVGGPHAPYVQSERLGLYQKAAADLAEDGTAYWCTCSPDRLEAMRIEQQRRGQPTRYDRHCLGRQAEVAEARKQGEPAVLRLKMPEGTSSWEDVVRGEITFQNSEIDDPVLLKSDGFPTYHLAVVVDDHEMEITHVLRGEEWIPSTPKHLVLYAAFGWTPPRFAHVPVVLGTDKKKLSKRHGAKSILEYRDAGYLPSAMVNAMALLGWTPEGEDILTADEIVSQFSLDAIHASPAVLDPQRLEAINAHHIRLLSDDALADAVLPFVTLPKDRILPLVPLFRERIPSLAAAGPLLEPLSDFSWSEEEFPPKNVSPKEAKTVIEATRDLVGTLSPDDLRERLTEQVKERGGKPRDAFRVLYCALYGRSTGIPVFDAIDFLGPEESRARLDRALDRLASAKPA